MNETEKAAFLCVALPDDTSDEEIIRLIAKGMRADKAEACLSEIRALPRFRM